MYLGGEFGGDPNCFDAYQASTFYAVDRLCSMKKLFSQIDKPSIILFDRYSQSNMIHQAGKIKDKEEREKFLSWVDNFEFEILKLPRVDSVVFLDVPVEISYRLANAREQLKIGAVYSVDIHEADKQHLEDSYKAAKDVASKFGWCVVDCVDADGRLRTPSEVHNKIKEVLGI
jgi:dTMP kinase